MYKFCTFIIFEGGLSAFERTIKSLTQAKGFEDTLLILVFDRMLYELDIEVFQIIDNLPEQNVKCLHNISSNTLLQQILADVPDTGFFFFIREGDEIDSNYLVYMDYFFEDNRENCDILLTPVVKPDKNQLPKEFINLPHNGIKLLDAADSGVLPFFTEGIVLSGRFFKNLQLTNYDEIDFLYEAILKAIIQKKCYGIINTVTYISGTEPEIRISAKLLKELVDYSSEFYDEVPLYLINLINEYTGEQLNGAANNFDKDIFMLREYIPHVFDEIDNSPFSLCITDVRNHYADVEITGIYTRPHWETETKLVISSTNNEITYEERLGNINQWKQEINFKVVLQLEHDNVSLQFEMHRENGLKLVKTVDFIALEEESGRINNYAISHADSKVNIKKIAPRAYYKVSCIIPVYNGAEYLKEAIESVISQSIDFFANIQILLVNNGSTDNTELLCMKYKAKYPYNIGYFNLEEPNVSKARNYGLQYAMGEYISFLDADDKLPPDYMAAGIKYLKSNEENIDMVAFPIEYFGEKANLPKPRLNFRFTKTAVIDVLKNPDYIQFGVCSTLIKRTAIERLAFNENLSYSEDAEFVHQVILNKMKYGVLDKPAYLYRVRENGLSATQSKKSQINWYMRNTVLGQALIDYSNEIHGSVTQYTQNLIIHDLLDNIVADIPEDITNRIDMPNIMHSISESLQYVEDSVIKASTTLDYWFKCFLLKLKYKEVILKKQDSVPEFFIGDEKFEVLKPKTYITAVCEKNNCLYVSGFYNLPSYDGIDLTAIYNGQAYFASISENRHKNIYFLGEAVHKARIFDFEIPVEGAGLVDSCIQVEGWGIIDFCIQVEGEGNYPVNLVFPYKANEKNTPSFFTGENILISSTSKINQINLEPRTLKRLSEMITNSLALFSKSQSEPQLKADKGLIKEYLSMYSIMSKSRIWLFMDEPKSANGNAEIMFSYSAKIKDGIEKYFIIDKNTMDGIRLEDAGTIIQYGSNMHKLLYLYAERIIISNAFDNSYNPFAGSELYSIYNGIMKAELVYLPNEPQTEDLSARLNRFTKNISLFATVSDSEREFVLSKAYGYSGNVVQAVGLPKYDRLLSNKQNIIIFMPSWREKLYPGENLFNFDFANSEYCKRISELLCDERLLDVMMENEYEMYFLPHDKTYLQLADFDMYENVNVISPDLPRLELFVAGALLITDWMPVADFAYMKKPVIYYRFAEDEAGDVQHFEAGFGETVLDNEGLVSRIIDYIQNGCVMQCEYMQQINEHFKYTDNKNCERIYTAINC